MDQDEPPDVEDICKGRVPIDLTNDSDDEVHTGLTQALFIRRLTYFYLQDWVRTPITPAPLGPAARRMAPATKFTTSSPPYKKPPIFKNRPTWMNQPRPTLPNLRDGDSSTGIDVPEAATVRRDSCVEEDNTARRRARQGWYYTPSRIFLECPALCCEHRLQNNRTLQLAVQPVPREHGMLGSLPHQLRITRRARRSGGRWHRIT